MPAVNRMIKLSILAVASLAMTGCVSLFPDLSKSDLPAESGEASVPTAKFFIELHPTLSRPRVIEGEINGPITVQQALEASGAINEFSSMVVDVHRRLPNGLTHKLPVEFKKGKKVINYEQDYSIHPNDRIVVRPKTNSALGKIVQQVFGEL